MFVSNYNNLAYKFVETFDYMKAPSITVIVGEEGLGKTTLLNYLLHKMKKKIRNITFVDAEKFSLKYAYAAQNGKLNAFRQSLRSSSLFLIDNINLLQGKNKTIEELFHTVDTILANGGKTVITYRGSKTCFNFLNVRFASHLKSGLTIHLQIPGTEELNNFITYYLAKGSSFQDASIESTVLSQLKNMKQVVELLNNDSIYHDEVKLRQLMNDCIDEKANIVVAYVCNWYGLEQNKVLGSAKSHAVVEARYMVYLLLHEICKYSYKEIAKHFNKDLGSLRQRCPETKKCKQELFDTLCKKLYNQLYSYSGSDKNDEENCSIN